MTAPPATPSLPTTNDPRIQAILEKMVDHAAVGASDLFVDTVGREPTDAEVTGISTFIIEHAKGVFTDAFAASLFLATQEAPPTVVRGVVWGAGIELGQAAARHVLGVGATIGPIVTGPVTNGVN